jgi:uncharacterized protein YqgC (DUF456 family)
LFQSLAAIDAGLVYNFFSGFLAFVSLVLLTLFYQKVGFSYWLLGVYSILIPLTTGTVVSMPRYTLVLFPLYLLAAKLIKNNDVDQALTIGFALLQGFLMALWSNGFYLM